MDSLARQIFYAGYFHSNEARRMRYDVALIFVVNVKTDKR